MEGVGMGNHFLNRTPTTQKIRSRIDEWDCMKLKSSCTSKGAITRSKRQIPEWKKIFAC
jgi:hypothetical protein